MLVIQVDKKEVKIPQKYSELPLNRWIGLWRVLCKHDVDKAPTTDEGVEELVIDEIQLTKELVGELLSLQPKEVDRLDFNQCNEVMETFNHMLDSDTFHEEQKWGEHKFTHKGETYYFPKTDFEEMTFGEYAALKQYETVLAQEQTKRFDIIPQQMAYSCRKKDEKKESYDLDERAKLFEDIPMDIVMKLTFFLQKRISSLQAITKIYSDKEATIAQRKRLDISSQDMGGLIQYIE